MKSSSPNTYFTAAQLAARLGISRKSVHEKMSSSASAARTMRVRGVQAVCWPVSALPVAVADKLGMIATRQACSIAHLLTAPPTAWQPEHPLTQIAPVAVGKAEMRRMILAPILGAQDAQMVTVSELVRRALVVFSTRDGDEKTPSKWAVRQWIEDAIERDRALWDWERLEIYLDAKPELRADEQPAPLPCDDLGGNELAAALQRLREPSPEKRREKEAEVWNAAFHRFAFLVQGGMSERHAKRAIERAMEIAGLGLIGRTVKARSNAWQRRFEKWNKGGQTAGSVEDKRAENSPEEVFVLTPEEKEKLRDGRLVKGSVDLAVDVLYHSPVCRPETRALIERYLNEAAQRRRAVNWPLSMRRAAHVTAEEKARFRGPKTFRQIKPITYRGMFYNDENGQRQPVRPNSIFESDDMSVNEPFTFLDPETGTIGVGRQSLCTQDVYSASWLSAMPVGRTRDAYRVEDVADHMLETVLAHGLPDVWRLERGAWENNFIDGIRLKDGTRWGSLKDLFHVQRTYSPTHKGGIEKGFDLVQSFMAHESTSIGRKRGEFEAGTKIMLRAQSGDEKAIAKLWPIGACANSMRDMMRLFNARPKKRDAFGHDLVVPDDLYRGVVRRECPADELWRFCPVKRAVAVRHGEIRVSDKFYPQKFSFRVSGNEDVYLEYGYPVLIAFHPGHPERGCHIFNAARGAENRNGLKFGQFLMVAPFVEPSPQYDLARMNEAEQKARAAVAQEFRSVATDARVSVSRDSFGRSTRMESSTGMPLADRTAQPIKKQLAEKRQRQADEIAKAAKRREEDADEMERIAAKIARRRVEIQNQLGILPVSQR